MAPFVAISHFAPVVCEWCMYAGALIAAGGLLFLLFIHDGDPGEWPPLARVVVAAAAVGGAATLASLPLQAFRIGGHPQVLLDVELLTAVLQSRYGTSALIRLAGIVVLLIAATRLHLGRPIAVGGTAAALATACSFVIMGHSGTAQPRLVVVGAAGAHLLAGAAWFAGLVLLFTLLGRRAGGTAAAARLISRFSTWALTAVVVLVASGATLAWAHGRSIAALADSAYGRTLFLKAVVLALVLAVAAYNRQRLVPAIRAGDAAAWRRIRRTVGTEAVGVGAVLALTAALINLAPPALDDTRAVAPPTAVATEAAG